jgi:hypothetical protein
LRRQTDRQTDRQTNPVLWADLPKQFFYGYAIGVNGTAAVTVVDNDNATVVSVTTATASIEESTSNAVVFQITRTGDTSQDLTVFYKVAGDAEPGVDYAGLPNYDLSDYEGQGSVTIPAGSSSVEVTVTPMADALAEGDESIIFTLSPSTSDDGGGEGETYSQATYVLSRRRTARTKIASWGSVPVVSIEATDDIASEAGSDPASFEVRRTGDISRALTVSYIVSGTATPGWDYTGLLDGYYGYYYGYYPYQTRRRSDQGTRPYFFPSSRAEHSRW